MLAVVVAEGVAVLLLAVLVAGLLRGHADILRALHDLGASTDDGTVRPSAARVERRDLGPARDITGTDLADNAVGLAVAGTAQDTLLAFLSTGCSTCEPFWSAFRDGVALPAATRLVVVVQDEESNAALRRVAAPGLDVVVSSAAWSDYDVPGSPHFVFVSGAGGRVVGEGTGPDWSSVAGLLLQAGHDVPQPPEMHQIEWRDNAARIDAELGASGIGPQHPSLTTAPESQAS
jgi:hypothetical protein